uniref:Peptidase S9 prolyl oligopeptidase catalytic domain-containing protein n=1 Tax=Aegilops tauschii subsp. strangulata TaxID=200361 RepID=A0A453MVI4_AEGTS
LDLELSSLVQVWDLIKLGDYLSARDDVDPSRIGIAGESLGGMHALFAAFCGYTVQCCCSNNWCSGTHNNNFIDMGAHSFVICPM